MPANGLNSRSLYRQCLSPIEDKVRCLLTSGLTEHEIAQKLGRSPHAIHASICNLYEKQLHSSAGLLMSALLDQG